MMARGLLLAAALLCSSTTTAFLQPSIHRVSAGVAAARPTTSALTARSLVTVAPAVQEPACRGPMPLRMSEGAAAVEKTGKEQRLKITGYFAIWYLLNIGYNITNKATLNRVALPWLVSSVQLVVGSIYIGLVWALKLRKAPKCQMSTIKTVFPLAFLHTSSHISAVIGLGAGAVGFVHVVKALEPLFTAALSALILNKFFPLPVYASLLPVVGGVALASMKELSFSWVAFAGAMGSNVAAATRGVLAKKQMSIIKDPIPNLDAGNLYGVMTIIAAAILFPAALLVEGPRIKTVWAAAVAAGHTSRSIWRGMVLSGLYFYTYNEVAMYCLNAIDPTTHAVGNTVKRVVLLGVSVLVFGHQLTPLGLAGSATAIFGVLIYSLTKDHYAKKEAAALKAKPATQ